MKIDFDTTKGKIIKAAIELFPEKGYERTSMKEIADSAGVTKPAVYYYFDNKEEMFKEIIDIGREHGYQQLKKILDSNKSFREKLIDMIMERFNVQCAQPEVEKFISWAFTNGIQYVIDVIHKSEEKSFSNHRELLTSFLKKEIEKGNLKVINTKHFFALLVGGINYHTREFYTMNRDRIQRQDAAEMVDILLYRNIK